MSLPFYIHPWSLTWVKSVVDGQSQSSNLLWDINEAKQQVKDNKLSVGHCSSQLSEVVLGCEQLMDNILLRRFSSHTSE